MSFTDWASALANIIMAISSIIAILVSYAYLHPTPSPHPTPCTAVSNVDALRRQLEELKQRVTDLEELKERLVGALY